MAFHEILSPTSAKFFPAEGRINLFGIDNLAKQTRKRYALMLRLLHITVNANTALNPNRCDRMGIYRETNFAWCLDF